MHNHRADNILGALALALSDTVLRGVEAEAPEPGQAASAIALLRHEPGMPIERLRRALALSHPGAVRLVDRLAARGLIERRPSSGDRRAVALHLTPAGEQSCTAILSARFERLEGALDILGATDRLALERLAEKLLIGIVRDVDHAYSVCRLCDVDACVDCPVARSLNGKDIGVDRD